MASLYVGNLHPNCSEALLFKRFHHAGKILNIHICKKGNSESSAVFGYINFAEKDTAQKVLDSMNYESILGLPVRLMWAKSTNKKYDPEANVFIKNLHNSIDERELIDIFAQYGDILSSKVVTDKFGNSKGIGYLQFDDKKSADSAIEGVNEKLLKGLKVTVCKFLPKNQRHESFTNIYLKNIPVFLSDEDLIKLCSKFGTIFNAKVMRDDDGHSKGFGFVNFKSYLSAKEAVEELNGTSLFGKKLYVGKAKSKKERQHELLENLRKKLQFDVI